jgi:hypothetical protein
MPQRKPLSPGSSNLFTLLTQIFVVLLAGGVLVYVLRFFLPMLVNRRGARRKQKKEARVVLGETLQPDQSASDLLGEAEQLARQGDLRGAIRKAYIALLVELGDRKVISLAQHKTNRDYLRAVRKVEPLYSSMKWLTDQFELHWYGFANASQDDWNAFRAAYHRALAG